MPKPLICNENTIAVLKSHRYYVRIGGRSKMNKAELCKALNKMINQKEAKKSQKRTTKQKKDVKTTKEKTKKHLKPTKAKPKKDKIKAVIKKKTPT